MPGIHIQELPDELLLLVSGPQLALPPASVTRGDWHAGSQRGTADQGASSGLAANLSSSGCNRASSQLQVFAQLAKVPPVIDDADIAVYERRLPFRT